MRKRTPEQFFDDHVHNFRKETLLLHVHANIDVETRTVTFMWRGRGVTLYIDAHKSCLPQYVGIVLEGQRVFVR